MSPPTIEMRAPGGGGRLDQILSDYFQDRSRSTLQALIRHGGVKVNGQSVTKPAHRLKGDEKLEIDLPAPELPVLQPEPIPLEIIFENNDLLVINKPAGLVVHPSPGHRSGTLANAIAAYAPEVQGVGEDFRPGLIHRLDKDTSGVLLFAKNEIAREQVQQQFRDHSLKKLYLALVDGAPPSPEGLVDAPIGRDPRNRKRFAIRTESDGKPAQTAYSTAEVFSDHSLLEVRPRTGRTHQIRVHLSFLGCPVTGDRVYGRRRPSLAATRHLLHARRLTLMLPQTGEVISFDAPLPDDLASVLAMLRESHA